MTDTITTTYICPPIPDRGHDWHAHFSWQDADALSCEGYGKTELDAKFALLQAAMDVEEDGSEQEAILDLAWQGLKAAETIKAAKALAKEARRYRMLTDCDYSVASALDEALTTFRAAQEKNDG